MRAMSRPFWLILLLTALLSAPACKHRVALDDGSGVEAAPDDEDAQVEDATDEADTRPDVHADAHADVKKDAHLPDVVSPVDDAGDGDASDDAVTENDVGAEDAIGPVDAPDAVQQPATLLFIGNSYTFVNDLPGMTVTLAKTVGLSWSQTSETVGGATLQDHIDQYGAVPQIAAGGHTWVVLQGQSVEPAGDPAFLKAAATLATAVKAAGGQTVFYQTWPRKAGDALYQQTWSGGTPAALFALLKQGYTTAAQQSGGVRVPAGDAWMDLLAKHPEIELYQADGSHPTVAGTYLNACVFVGKLGGVDPTTFTWVPPGIKAAEAAALRASAKVALGL